MNAPSYFEHCANQGKARREEVSLDVVQFDMPEQPTGITVVELDFETTWERLEFVRREIGK